MFTPVVVPRIGYCERECNGCGEVCPTGALRPFLPEEKPDILIGLAAISRSSCIMWRRQNPKEMCLVCDEQCSYKAVKWELIEGLKRPVVDPDLCTGCGQCEEKCPVQPLAAIVVYRREQVQ